MKKTDFLSRNSLLLLFLAMFGSYSFSQTLYNQDHVHSEKCGTHILHNQMMLNDPAAAARQNEFELHMQSIMSQPEYRVDNLLRVPVVVHVLHKGEAVGVGTNVSDDAIRTAIQNMNKMYRKQAPWNGNGVDMEMEFVLAVRDPNGQCTNGITRVSMTSNSAYMSAGVRLNGSVGITDAQLKAVTSWDRTRYYNIYLVSEIDNNEGGAGIQGYAYFASSHGQSNDGAVILSSNFTSGTSTTAAHEIGHALNLYHTFEGDGSGGNCPTQQNGCGNGVGDCCGDTPPHRRSSSDCNATGSNNCTSPASSNSLFVRNYMDYSSDACQNMFTANQRTRATQALTVTRASFLAASNLALVPPGPSVVDFIADRSVICAGQTVTFIDMSSCVPNPLINSEPWSNITFSWSFSNGVVNLTSTEQNPIMNFTSPGAYNVTLTVTTPQGTYSLTKPNFVVLGGSVVNACTPTSQNSGNFAQTISRVSFNTFSNNTSSFTNAAYTNFICDKNTIVQPGQTYALSVTANAATSGSEEFEVYIDYNNNGTFETTERVHFGTVAAGTSQNVNTQTLTTNVTIPTTAVVNTLLRMRVFGERGTITANKRACTSAFFIGDVEDYGVYISDATAGPIASFTPSATTVCAGQTVTFNNTSSGNPTSYAWTFQGGSPATSTAVSPTVTYSTPGTYTVELTVSNADGSNTATQTNLITVAGGNGASLPVTEGFTATAFPPTGWSVINTDASAITWARSATVGLAPTAGNSMFFNNFDQDDRPNQDEVKLAAVNLTGTTTATLTFDVAYAGFDATYQDGLEVLVSTDCEATFTSVYSKTGSVLATAPNQTSAFNPTTAGQWRAETVNLSAYVGQNNVVLKFRNLAGYGNRLYVDNINIAGGAVSNDPPVASFTASNSTLCAGQTVSFTNTTTGGATSYAWSFPGGTPATSTEQNPTVTYSSPGTFNVELIATNANGSNTATQSNMITVNATPTITGTTPASRCGTGTVNLSATASGGTISWFTAATGGTAVGTGATFTTPSIATTTTYYVEVTQNGCTSTRTPVIATINALPTVTANSTTPTICQGSNAQITASGASTYSWSPGGQTGASISVSPSSTTTYTVTGTGTNGCTNTATSTITVTGPITVNVMANNTSICQGQSATLTASGASTYSWSPGGQTGASITVSPTTTTTYTVTGTNGCTDTETITITVNPTPVVTLSTLPQVCVNTNPFTLSQGSPAGGTYSGNGVSGTTFNPATAGVGNATITYSVTQNGCTGTATGIIVVSECLNVEDQTIDLYLIYPNPTDGLLTVKGTELTNFSTIELMDMTGRIIESWTITSSEMNMDLRSYANGNYNVRISNESNQKLHQIQILK